MSTPSSRLHQVQPSYGEASYSSKFIALPELTCQKQTMVACTLALIQSWELQSALQKSLSPSSRFPE